VKLLETKRIVTSISLKVRVILKLIFFVVFFFFLLCLKNVVALLFKDLGFI
jgi:uncharacterized protein HemY